jgi:hypothetical protein
MKPYIRLLSFGDHNYRRALSWLKNYAHEYGANEVVIKSGKDFSNTQFYQQHIAIASAKRGAGYWLWKPFYILEQLKSLQPGDILIYADAGVLPIQPLAALIHFTNEHKILLFENYQGSDYIKKTSLPFNLDTVYVEMNKNYFWCKRDVFIGMNADDEAAWNSPQVDASFQVYVCSEQAIDFVEEWLTYCITDTLITDHENRYGQPNHALMIKHLHDQSILSVLAHKKQISLFRSPSQFGNHYKTDAFRIAGEYLMFPYHPEPKLHSPYGTLLWHHRTGRSAFGERLKQFLLNEIKIMDDLYFGGILQKTQRGK